MDFQPASQNGIIPANQLGDRISPHSLIVNTTATYYRQGIYLRLINTAPYPKEVPATFTSQCTRNGTTSTIVLGEAFFDGPVATLKTYLAGTGTNIITASWPGESRYAGFETTLETPITISAGLSLSGTSSLHAYPITGQVVTGEGEISFTAIFNTTPSITGKVYFYDDAVQLGSANIINNGASFTINTLDAGTRTIRAVWEGEIINGSFYQGISNSITYEVLAGSTLNVPLLLSLNPTRGVVGEGNITFTAGFTTSTQLFGTIKIINAGTGIVLTQGAISNNSVALSIFNSFPAGNPTFQAIWDGNSTGHPRYIPVSSDIELYTQKSRETITSAILTLTPPNTYRGQPVTLTASFTAPTEISGTVNFYDNNTLIGSVAITNNQATLSLLTLTVGNHVLYASFGGSTTPPKYYAITTNNITTSTLAGETLNFSLAFSQYTYLDPSPGYYIKEPINLILTNNSVGTNVSGSIATFSVDDVQVSNTFRLLSTNGTTSTVYSSANLSAINTGTKLYSNAGTTNLIGTVITTGTNSLKLNSSVLLNNTPIWFVGPNYYVAGTAPFINNTATKQVSVKQLASVYGISDWLGTQLNNGHYYIEEVQTSNPITVGKRLMPKLYLSINTTSNIYPIGISVPVTIADTSTVKYYNLTGLTATIYNNTLTLITEFINPSSLTYMVPMITTGTHVFSGIVYGDKEISNITDDNRKYYLNGSTTTNNTSVIVVPKGIPTGTVTLSTSSYAVYDGDGNAIITPVSALITLTGSQYGTPSGRIDLYDVTGTPSLLNSGTLIVSGGSSSISLNFIPPASYAGNNMLLEYRYYGDYWNTSTTLTKSLPVTKYIPKLSIATIAYLNAWNTNPTTDSVNNNNQLVVTVTKLPGQSNVTATMVLMQAQFTSSRNSGGVFEQPIAYSYVTFGNSNTATAILKVSESIYDQYINKNIGQFKGHIKALTFETAKNSISIGNQKSISVTRTGIPQFFPVEYIPQLPGTTSSDTWTTWNTLPDPQVISNNLGMPLPKYTFSQLSNYPGVTYDITLPTSGSLSSGVSLGNTVLDSSITEPIYSAWNTSTTYSPGDFVYLPDTGSYYEAVKISSNKKPNLWMWEDALTSFPWSYGNYQNGSWKYVGKSSISATGPLLYAAWNNTTTYYDLWTDAQQAGTGALLTSKIVSYNGFYWVNKSGHTLINVVPGVGAGWYKCGAIHVGISDLSFWNNPPY